MTEGGPSGGDGGRGGTNVPATPGELPTPPTPQPPGQSPQPASSFPGQEAATMRLIPTLPKPGVTPPPSMAERHIGKYVVKRELGRGGMGAVYLAEQTGLNRGAIPLPQVFAVMHGVLQALDYAHRHAIVHRDMKPENVLLSDEGDVKVADFGIARLTDDSAGPGSTATKTGTTVGTPQYMSPEQVASSKVDGRSDLYSAGIMFYELIVGEPPFTASEADGPFTLMAKHVQAPPRPPSVLKPGLDPQLEEIVLKSLSKRPEDRYQNGQEFDESVSGVADRLCPGWQRSLDPGADLTKMVPRTSSL